MDKIAWNSTLSIPLSCSKTTSDFHPWEPKHCACVFYAISRTCLKPVCRAIFFSKKGVGMPNFSRFWATWQIAMKSSHWAGLPGALQLLVDNPAGLGLNMSDTTVHVRQTIMEAKRASFANVSFRWIVWWTRWKKGFWNTLFLSLFLFFGTHFRVLVRKFLIHLRMVYASPQKLAQPLHSTLAYKHGLYYLTKKNNLSQDRYDQNIEDHATAGQMHSFHS